MIKKIQSQYSERIDKLKEARKEVFGMGQDIEKIWRQADHDYVPHLIQAKGKKVLEARDETKGWASRFVEIGADNWETKNATVNPYIKINTALAIMIARNPSVDLQPDGSKYEASTQVQKELYRTSWERAKSLQQLKLFAFDDAKYGWACGRTYPLKTPDFNGTFRERLDPWMTWIDDKSRPNNPMSTRDWCFAKWIPYETLKKQFSKAPNWKYIQEGESVGLDNEDNKSVPKFTTKNMKLAYFYENLDDDIYSVIVDGYPLLERELPIADLEGRKYLTLWHTYWTPRHSNSPMGIGINEAIRDDKNLYDKIRNMTMNQLILSIHKMFFYSGTDQIDGDGTIKIKPGIGKQVTNPENIKWMEVPGPGKDGYNGIEMQQKAIDDACGVGKELAGQTDEKTAFQSAQNAEFGMRRLSTPLTNITDALEQEAQITMVINRMVYSVPEVITITRPELIQDYYNEIKGDPELYTRENGKFQAKLYPEVQIGTETDDSGRLMESEENRFFRVHPKGLPWNGTITVKGQSILIETKVLQKAQTQEIFNIITPLLGEAKEIVMKPIKQLLKRYDFDWRDWVPDEWYQPQPQQQQQQGLFVPQEGGGGNMANSTILPKNQVAAKNTNLVGRTAGQLSSPGLSLGK